MVQVRSGPDRLGWFARCLLLAGYAALGACNGPHEQAGRDQDKSAAQSRGEPYRGSGPNQRLGQAQDRADDADRQLRDANGEVLKAQGREIRRNADVDATRLDEQSRAIRDAANVRARAVETEAGVVRK